MLLRSLLADAVAPALALLPEGLDSRSARVMLLAICLQESRAVHRRQIGGPARGLWQFERGGGVRGVLAHVASSACARRLCAQRSVPPQAGPVYARLEHDDVLAAGFARLLLWTDPAPLPAVGQDGQAWALYERVWRPGKPHPGTWSACYAQAVAAC